MLHLIGRIKLYRESAFPKDRVSDEYLHT